MVLSYAGIVRSETEYPEDDPHERVCITQSVRGAYDRYHVISKYVLPLRNGAAIC